MRIRRERRKKARANRHGSDPPNVTNMGFGPNGADTLYVTGAFDPWKPPFPGVVYRWSP
jgi:hypothetical protein